MLRSRRRLRPALKAGLAAGPRSPSRVSARAAALPAGFVGHAAASSYYGSLTMKERDQAAVRVPIGELSAGLLHRDARLVCRSLDTLDSVLASHKGPAHNVRAAAARVLRDEYRCGDGAH